MWKQLYKTEINEIIKYSSLCYNRNMVTAAGGNISMKCKGGILITGTNVPLRDVKPDDILLIDYDGSVIECSDSAKPSKESFFHVSIYNNRPDVNCVIHVHPPYAIAFSINKMQIPLVTDSARLKLGNVPIIPSADPGSAELAKNVTDAICNTSNDVYSYLMENHGTIALGKDMESCFNTAELTEDTARIAYLARTIKF